MDLVTVTEEIRNGKLFCAVFVFSKSFIRSIKLPSCIIHIFKVNSVSSLLYFNFLMCTRIRIMYLFRDR